MIYILAECLQKVIFPWLNSSLLCNELDLVPFKGSTSSTKFCFEMFCRTIDLAIIRIQTRYECTAQQSLVSVGRSIPCYLFNEVLRSNGIELSHFTVYCLILKAYKKGDLI